jgi:hypothetical protein
MQRVLVTTQMLIRLCGVVLLILGLLIWTENARNLINLHMLLGLLLVLAMLVLAGIALRQGAPAGMAVAVVVVAIAVLWLGITQTSLMPGSNHWVIQVVHLLLGLFAVAMCEVVGGQVRRMRLASA